MPPEEGPCDRFHEGYQEGFGEGKAEGINEGSEAAENRIAALRARLAEVEAERYATLRALISCVADYQSDSALYVFGAKPNDATCRKEVRGWLRESGATVPEEV